MTEPPRFPGDEADKRGDPRAFPGELPGSFQGGYQGGFNDLWRRLARAQDSALANAAPRASRPIGRETGDPSRGRRNRIRGGVVLLAAGAAIGLVAAVAHRAPLRFQIGRTSEPGAAGHPLLTDARSDLPLQFSDGSTITFRAGSGGRMQRLTDSGAEVVLEHGRLDAHVVHAESTLWLVHAGPFQVRVTGTRFAVGWSAPKLEVAVYEGSVVVEGAPLGAGVPLSAGHRLTIENGVVRTDLLRSEALRPGRAGAPRVAGTFETIEAQRPVIALNDPHESRGSPGFAPESPNSLGAARDPLLPAAASDAPAHGRAAPGPSAPGPSRDGEWLALAKRGAYARAHAVARRLGWHGLCDRLDARRLLMLGDVARYAGARAEARRAFESLVRRFSDDRLAADAVFSLGRLAFEAERPAQAARWFKRYVRDWPNGPLADQASGRLIECATRLHDRGAARDAAQAYLARAPMGPHAPLARNVLERPVDGPL